MKNFSLRDLLFIEASLLLILGLFSFDFLPRNHAEYLTICKQEWSNDAKQYQICMKPYFDQTNLDKYAVGLFAAVFVAAPVFYLLKKNK